MRAVPPGRPCRRQVICVKGNRLVLIVVGCKSGPRVSSACSPLSNVTLQLHPHEYGLVMWLAQAEGTTAGVTPQSELSSTCTLGSGSLVVPGSLRPLSG